MKQNEVEETSDIDAILAETEASTNNEIPMTNENEVAEQAPQEPQAQPQPQEYEFQYNGQAIKAPVEKILKWASMGYGAPQKIGELSKRIQDYEGKVKEYETYAQTYKPIDEWAKQNPDKWSSLLQQWQQAQLGGQAPANPASIPPEILQKVQTFEQRFQELDQKEQVQREARADQTLDQEIVSIRKEFSNLDFDAPDERGNSLEYRILEHATKNGISTFRAAFRDYCFDDITKLNESKGLERGQKAMPASVKAGLLGKDPAPQKRGTSPDLKGRNYDQIHQMILEKELGITG